MEFLLRAVKYHKSSFERQIHESVKIQTSRKYHFILNSKAEFNRCAIPRLGLKFGDREFKEKIKEQEEEKEKEEELHRKIIELRKARNKSRNQTIPPKDQPAKKKVKLDLIINPEKREQTR